MGTEKGGRNHNLRDCGTAEGEARSTGRENRGSIGIGEGLTAFALRHHRAYGTVCGGSCILAQCSPMPPSLDAPFHAPSGLHPSDLTKGRLCKEFFAFFRQCPFEWSSLSETQRAALASGIK